MDIKKTVEELVEKITKESGLLDSFKKNPVKVVEKLLGIDLPDETIQKIVEGIKAKLSLDQISGIAGAIGNILGKKG